MNADKNKNAYLRSSAFIGGWIVFKFLYLQHIPSEIPHPDGNLRIRQAGEDSRAALQNYKRALNRFTDYALSGTVPKDLLRPA
jgi:hypothetical protein